jgi:hypothetical protein
MIIENDIENNIRIYLEPLISNTLNTHIKVYAGVVDRQAIQNYIQIKRIGGQGIVNYVFQENTIDFKFYSQKSDAFAERMGAYTSSILQNAKIYNKKVGDTHIIQFLGYSDSYLDPDSNKENYYRYSAVASIKTRALNITINHTQ